jgi:hypothetical protein
MLQIAKSKHINENFACHFLHSGQVFPGLFLFKQKFACNSNFYTGEGVRDVPYENKPLFFRVKKKMLSKLFPN